MNRWEMQKYELSAGSRGEAVRVIKELLHQNPRNSYKRDGTNVFDGKLQAALAEFQRAARLPNKSGTLDEQTWAELGAGVSALRLQQMTVGQIDTQIYGLLVGAFVGGGLHAQTENVASQTVGDDSSDGSSFTITFDGDWYLQNDFGKQPVLTESDELLDDATGRMATNVYRAIKTYRATQDYPTKSVKYKFEGSVGLGTKGKKIIPTGGEVTVGAEIETTSGDEILLKLTLANDNIREILVDALEKHDYGHLQKANTLPLFRKMGDIPTDNAPNLASSFGLAAKKKANEIARGQHKSKFPEKPIPSKFLYTDF